MPRPHFKNHGVNKGRRRVRYTMTNLRNATPTESEVQMALTGWMETNGPSTHSDLLNLCEDQGGTWRPLAENCYIVWHPSGESFKFRLGARGKLDRKRAILAARDAGFIIPGPEYNNETKESTEVTTPMEARINSMNALMNKVDELESKLDRHESRIDAHGERLTELKRDIERVANGVRPLKSDKYTRMRDEVMEWFSTVPAGIWFGYRAIMDNMGIDNDRAHSYQQQLQNLVNEGRLEQKRGGQASGSNRGGASYLYRTPVDPVNTDG